MIYNVFVCRLSSLVYKDISSEHNKEDSIMISDLDMSICVVVLN